MKTVREWQRGRRNEAWQAREDLDVAAGAIRAMRRADSLEELDNLSTEATRALRRLTSAVRRARKDGTKKAG